MKRADMVRVGAEQLINAEKAVETAFSQVTALATSLSGMRLDANLSMGVGRDAMKSITSSIHLLGAVREEMIDAHQHLDTVKTQIGCRTVMVGHLDKPERDPASVPPQGLHVVSQQRSA